MNNQPVWNRCRVVPEDRDGHCESDTTTVSSGVMGVDDTDTTAAITGAMSGVDSSVSNMPRHFVEEVKDTGRLQEFGRAIHSSANSQGNDHYDSSV